MNLPIDRALPDIVGTLREPARRAGVERGTESSPHEVIAGSLVVVAEPGAGKTTRVPPALLRDGGGEVLVLEPRRIAARLAARRVAEERGERVGETVGYQVRFEDVSGPKTRLRFLTEGILARRLLGDPALASVATVILDEFHERHVHGDVALALLDRLRRERRPDLEIVVMSATLDPEPVAALLGAPVIEVPGRTFEVEIEHAPIEDRAPLEERVREALERLIEGGLRGHVLVFLPGAAEIARAHAACAPLADRHGLLLLPLHGALPLSEQERALRPAAERKVILSTNVAESSITIDGVAAVIDGGLARVASHSPWSGLPALRVEPVSRAAAAQRAGRAGRTGPGSCVRLYTRRDHDMRPPFATPEILRLDLAETVLGLAAAGIADPAGLRWLEPPPGAALEAARTLLGRLGAIDGAGRLTPTGERMLRFPLHPRLARVIVAAEDLGVAEEGAAIAALLGERDLRRSERVSRALSGEGAAPGRAAGDAASDVLEMLHDRESLRAVEQARAQLARLARGKRAARLDPERREEALLEALLAGHPDRVARRRAPGSDELLLVEGGMAALARESAVRSATWLVALDAEERRTFSGAPGGGDPGRRGGALVRLASAIEPEWLIDLFPDAVREEVEVGFDARAERVEIASRLVYGALVLDERRGGPTLANPEEVRAVLSKAALAAGPEAFADPAAIAAFLARVAFARTLAPDLPALGEAEVRAALGEMCAGRRSFAELRAAGLLEAVRERLSAAERRIVDRLAPEWVVLPSGRRARVRYEAGRPPRVASRLQDFFGATAGPRIGGGEVPLVLELLAPNQRPVQVTTDLAGFWERHYPAIRRELGRRYPKHAWPEDPLGPARRSR